MTNKLTMSVLVLVCILLVAVVNTQAQTAQEFYDRGNDAVETGNYDKAAADYTQGIKLDPNNAWAYFYRGALYHKNGNYDRAIADFTKSSQIDPTDAQVYYYRGISYFALHKED